MPYRLKADADLAKALGATLRTLRKLRGYKINGVHEATGLAKTSLAAWEQGRHLPSLQNLRALTDFYRIRLSALLTNTETAMALIPQGARVARGEKE